MPNHAEQVRRRVLEGHPLADALFDSLYPAPLRAPSASFWTPVAVARRAAALLDDSGAERILDVGSGVGKLCLVGAITTRAAFVGLEHRGPLVDAARRVAGVLGVADRATFVYGTVETYDLSTFDALYFYNPFGENLLAEDRWLDGTVEVSPARFRADLAAVQVALDAMPLGARMVTYHGMGGWIPDTFRLEHAEPAGNDALHLWIKRTAHRRSFFAPTARGSLPPASFARPSIRGAARNRPPAPDE